MPELPEVEVTRRSFAGAIEGATVRGITVGKPLRWPLGTEPAVLVGRRMAARRAERFFPSVYRRCITKRR